MAATPSTMIDLGSLAPNFLLPNPVSGEDCSLTELKGKLATVVMFICNHCPFVKHINPELVQLGKDFIPRDISFIAISSNDAENYPEDSPEMMKEVAKTLNYPFPYLYDESQEVAKAYDAACTPDFFIYDSELRLVYRGQLDDSRPSNGIPVSGRDIRAALDAILYGKSINPQQKPSIGCNIKWKS